MCCSDYYAVILMKYFSERGVSIPEDLSFTGFDDILLARVVSPELTTVRQDITEKGRCSVEYLLKMIQGIEPFEWNVKLPVEIIVRGSVKAIGQAEEQTEKMG